MAAVAPPRGPSQPLRRRWAVAGLVAAVLVLLVAIGLLAAGWHYSGVLGNDAFEVRASEAQLSLTIDAVSGDTITLRRRSGDGGAFWDQPGTFGVESGTGYGQVSEITARTGDTVTRRLTPISGTLTVGQLARVERDAYPDSPKLALGMDFQEVAVPGPLGPLPAWYIDGRRETWAILVHGHRGSRTELLRQALVFTAMGFKTLIITYRNDPGVARDPSDRYQFGDTEWRDLEAAVSYAKANGAADVVLSGVSMGGAIVVSLLERSDLAGEVRASVLEAPVLDFGETIRFRADRRNAPGVVTAIGMWLSSPRYDVDWGAVNYLDAASHLRSPILLIHGTADSSVPLSTSAELARKRPDIVTFIRVEGAGHLGAWNTDPARFEGWLRDFLEAEVPDDGPSGRAPGGQSSRSSLRASATIR